MRKRVRRIGIFGGSFDPPHFGHLVIAEMARRSLKLETVFMVPAYRPPHKTGRHPATARDRLHMTRLATTGNRHLKVSDLELKRKGTSYTIDTVRAFQRRFPKAELFLILGGDSLRQFHSWKDPRGILALCSLAVYRRPKSGKGRLNIPSSRIVRVAGPLMHISSSSIRQMVLRGKSIHELVRENVAEYIVRKKLYTDLTIGRDT